MKIPILVVALVGAAWALQGWSRHHLGHGVFAELPTNSPGILEKTNPDHHFRSLSCTKDGVRYIATRTYGKNAGSFTGKLERHNVDAMINELTHGGKAVYLIPAHKGDFHGWECALEPADKHEVWFILWMDNKMGGCQLRLQAPMGRSYRSEAARFFATLSLDEKGL